MTVRLILPAILCLARISPSATRVWADPLLVKLALNQIVDNAAKYGTPGSRISVSVRDTDAETVIAIRNEGSFIRSEDLQRIFTRFYRTSGSEHQSAGDGYWAFSHQANC